MAFTVVEYVREDGLNPYKRWFDSLDAPAATRVAVARARLEAGNTSNLKRIGSIAECRIDWGPGYRIYFLRANLINLVLLCAGDKSTQKRDIERAKQYAKDYRNRL